MCQTFTMAGDGSKEPDLGEGGDKGLSNGVWLPNIQGGKKRWNVCAEEHRLMSEGL